MTKRALFLLLTPIASLPAAAGEIGVSHTIGNYVRHGTGRMQFESVKTEDITENTTSVAKQIDLFLYGEETGTGKPDKGNGLGLGLTDDYGAGNNGNEVGNGKDKDKGAPSGTTAGRGFSLSYVSATGTRNLTSNEVVNASGGEEYTFSESNFTRRSSVFSF